MYIEGNSFCISDSASYKILLVTINRNNKDYNNYIGR